MSSATPRPLTTGQIQTYYQAFKLAKYGVDFAWFYEGIRLIDLLWLDVATSRAKKTDVPESKGSKTAAPIPKYKRPN